MRDRETVWPAWKLFRFSSIARPVALDSKNGAAVNNKGGHALAKVRISGLRGAKVVIVFPVRGDGASKNVAKNLRSALEANCKFGSVERKKTFGADFVLWIFCRVRRRRQKTPRKSPS